MNRPRYQTTDDVISRAGLPANWKGTPHTTPAVRTPLTTNQHILHLLLTVFTAGLWLPVWIILAIRGNRR
jgi:hypothetical protein